MTSPVPGFTAPSPRTWSKGDFITTPRLRGDMTNLAAMYAGGARPMFLGSSYLDSVTLSAGVEGFVPIAVAALNSWNVPVLTTSGPGIFYEIPLAGYWLLQGGARFITGGAAAYTYAMGFGVNVNGTGLSTNGGAVPSSTANVLAAPSGCELFQFNTYANTTVDGFVLYGYSDSPDSPDAGGQITAEWAGLPTSGLTNYTGPYGTVVSPPTAAVPFPSGPGTTITNSGGIAAGATSVTVASATGMITGGTLGLDFTAGQYYEPYAEPVSITSVTGTTIGISATSYAHAQGAPVAVPDSAAFLNQQVRDQINFLSYPPLARAQTTTTQSVPSQSFPAGTQVTNLSDNIDTFSAFSSNTFTAPVAGTYLVYGQVYYAGLGGTSFTYSAGLQQNAGTIQWGVRPRCNTAGTEQMCATVRRLLRLAKGDTIKLYAFQDSGSAMNTVANATTPQRYSKLIALWRSF